MCFLHPLDLFQLDASLMSLESMLEHVELIAKQRKKVQPSKHNPSNDEMLERMHSISVFYHIMILQRQAEFLVADRTRLNLGYLLLKRQYRHLDNYKLSIMDHCNWAFYANHLFLHLWSAKRFYDSCHVYCAARVALDDADEELKEEERWKEVNASINESGVGFCINLLNVKPNKRTLVLSEPM